MAQIPLQIFFETLENDGFKITFRDHRRVATALRTSGEWTVRRLRVVLLSLLVRDIEKKDLFLRRFDDFFRLSLKTKIKPMDLASALSDLKTFTESEKNTDLPPDGNIRPVLPTWSEKTSDPSRKWIWPLLLTLLCVCLLLFYQAYRPVKKTPEIRQPGKSVEIRIPETKIDHANLRTYKNVPRIDTLVYLQPESRKNIVSWPIYTGILFIGLIAYILYLLRHSSISDDKAPDFDREGRHHFRMGDIGGSLPPRLDRETLDQLADYIGYFQSEHPGRLLDVSASVNATIDRGGIPTPVFRHRKQMYTVLILEDEFSDQTRWNTIAGDLAKGLKKRGAPVIFGTFEGSPHRFYTENGIYHLEDFEDMRRGILLLIFSDGKGMTLRRDAFTMESLVRWPMLAWMSMTEIRFQQPELEELIQAGIPMYPASKPGVVSAMRRFVTEQGIKGSIETSPARKWPARQTHVPLAAYLYDILADALPWAIDCAMVQPVPLPLADALRRKFHPHVPFQSFQRLIALPKTSQTVAGIRFSDSVTAFLRREFSRRPAQMQTATLKFILSYIKKKKPFDTRSIEYLTWDFYYQRVRMEIASEHDDAVKRIAELSADGSPLAAHARTDMAKTGSLDRYSDDDEYPVIPLMVESKDPASQRRLGNLTAHAGARFENRFPLSRTQKWVLSVMIFILLAVGGWTGRQMTAVKENMGQIFVSSQHAGDLHARLERKTGDTWETVAQINEGGKTEPIPRLHKIDRNDVYRFSLLQMHGQVYVEPDIQKMDAAIGIQWDAEKQVSCRETVPEIGLEIIRCPDDPHEVPNRFWAEKLKKHIPENRVLSIGVMAAAEPMDEKIKEIIRRMLATSSIDVMYRIVPDKNGRIKVDDAAAFILKKMGAWAQQSQLIILTDNRSVKLENTEIIREFGLCIQIGSAAQQRWEDELISLFDEKGRSVITGDDLKKVDAAKVLSGDLDSLVLSRTFPLRSRPKTLSVEDVAVMIKKHNFFCKTYSWTKEYHNETGDFENDFVDNKDGTITDGNTGLMWQKSGSNEYMQYDQAHAYINQINIAEFAGYNDWRLPTLEELASLLESKPMNKGLYIDPVFDDEQYWCWSSDKRSVGGAWGVDFDDGYVYWNVFNYYVRGVRSGQ